MVTSEGQDRQSTSSAAQLPHVHQLMRKWQQNFSLNQQEMVAKNVKEYQ